MLKTLMKKQFLEMTAFIFQNKKDGKKRSKGHVLIYAALMLYLVGMFGSMFYTFSDELCNVYFDIGYGWLYFTLFGLFATGIGVFMSIFSVYSSIYQAKDNEFLLSLPIKPTQIITTKLLGSYVMTFLFEALVLVPCLAVFVINREWTALSIVFGVLSIFLLPLLALTIACLLGFVIALIASKLPKNFRTFVTLLVSVAFMGAYFYMISGSENFMTMFIENPDGVAGVARYILYPVYAFGKGMTGEISSYLIFAGLALLLFSIVHGILSRTFIRTATSNKGSIVKKFQKKSLESSSVNSTLLKREFIHLKSSATYMLNCCMGTLMTLLATGFIIICNDKISQLAQMLSAEQIGLIACAAVAFISGMNDITAPSVSIEGKSIWVLQSLPVSPWKVLKTKISFHMILTVIPALIFVIVLQFIVDMPIAMRIMSFVCAFVFPLFEAAFGLMLNLKMPNLNWTDEMVAVKQGANVLIAIFGGWVVVITLGLLYILLIDYILPIIYLVISVAIVLAVTIAMIVWIKKKGTMIFSNL